MVSKSVFVGLFFAVVFFSILTSAHADLSDLKYNINVIKGEAAPGEQLEYNVSFVNGGSEQLKVSLNALFTGVTSISPSVFTLNPGEEKIVHVALTVKSTQTPGNVYIRLFVFDDKGNQFVIFLPSKILPSPKLFENVNIKSVKLSGEALNPSKTFSVTLNVDNPVQNTTVPLEIELDGNTIYTKDVFLTEGSNVVSLEGISLPEKTTPGDHNLKVLMKFSNGVVVSKEVVVPVVGYHKCLIDESMKTSLAGKKYVAVVRNIGTENATCLVSSSITGIEKTLLGRVTEDYAFRDNKIEWNVELAPFEEKTIEYEVNYVPLWIIPFVIVGAIVGVWYLMREVSVKKELVSYVRHPGFMDLKIQIKIKNLTGKVLKNVNVIEPLPAFIKEVRDYGTIPGELKKKKGRKSIVWEIDSLNPKEERVLSYKVRTSVEVLGSVNFEPTEINYKDDKGTKKKGYSNVLSIEIE
jgi:hypothetical protein